MITENNTNILIIGDIMLDEYINVKISKIANEAPIPVFSYSDKKYILGGCGNVYQNMKLFNNNLYLLSVIVNDNNGMIIKNMVNDSTNIIIDNYRRTTVKTRIIAENKILLRYDNEDTFLINYDIETQIIERFNLLFDKIDIVVFSDYNKGVLTKHICQYIINKCNQYNKVTIGDLKYNFDNFTNITLTKPNLLEATNYTKETNLIEIHKHIIETIKCRYSIITLGKEGISLYENNNLYKTSYSSEEIIDVTGAGDIVTSVIGSLYNKTNLKTILNIATYLGTLSVKKLGTYCLNYTDILKAYSFNKNKDLTPDIIYYLKKSNSKIVFTNGCFDILHIGHIQYLEQAKKLGDYMIVGINSDNSVSRLKGPKRPINKIDDRIDFLKKFDFIDFVVEFNQDTPQELIKLLEPDILVKGGDYTHDTVVGREYAKQVVILPLVEGNSTTNIINKI
jgi:D-beta-D-heptose 7-phosphate kinase/D-beta-D-heptose 1-phosphate adenosyltransferase